MTSVPAAGEALPGRDDRGAVWRATQNELWVARRDGRHLGTVECGHRFLANDADGEPIGAYRTLDTAMVAVRDQRSRITRARRRRERSWGPVPVVVTVAVAAGVMLGAYSMLLF